MRYNTIKLFIYLTLVMTSWASANTVETIDMTSIASKWTFECEESLPKYERTKDFTAVQLLKEHALLSLQMGMKNLVKINPQLSTAVAKALNKNIKVTCPSLPGGTLGEANPFWGTLKINSAVILSLLAAKMTKTESGDSLIFHEMLHLARIDNFSVSVHNNPRADISADVVYSCASASFSALLNKCVVCRLAEKHWSGSVLKQDQASINESESFCRNFYSGTSGEKEPLTITPKDLDPDVYNRAPPASRSGFQFVW